MKFEFPVSNTQNLLLVTLRRSWHIFLDSITVTVENIGAFVLLVLIIEVNFKTKYVMLLASCRHHFHLT